MVRTKVFVGNLSFNTKENELAKEFEVGGKVISANIITRGPRSLGYGFVEMDSEQDAENAVKLLNKKEIDGRPINVEVAKPREEGTGDSSPRTGTNNGRGSPRGGRGGRGRGGFRGSRGGMNRRFRRRDGSGSEEEGEGEQQQGGERRRGGFRGRGRGGRGGNGSGSPRSFRREDRPDNRAPSQTTLFVANLPFSLDDDAFAKVLKDQNLAFKSAHVVKKKSGRSKGFGFVEFDNQGDQQKALAVINNKDVGGRELVAKVALTENRSPENAPSEKKEEEKKPETTTSTTPSTTSTSSPSPAKAVTPKTEKK